MKRLLVMASSLAGLVFAAILIRMLRTGIDLDQEHPQVGWLTPVQTRLSTDG
jgi:hypothetical protein